MASGEQMDYRDILTRFIQYSDGVALLRPVARTTNVFTDEEWDMLRVLAGVDDEEPRRAGPAPAYELPDLDNVFLGKKDGQWPVLYFQAETHAIGWQQEQHAQERRRLWRARVELLEELTVVTPAPRLVTVLKPPRGYAKTDEE